MVTSSKETHRKGVEACPLLPCSGIEGAATKPALAASEGRMPVVNVQRRGWAGPNTGRSCQLLDGPGIPVVGHRARRRRNIV